MLAPHDREPTKPALLIREIAKPKRRAPPGPIELFLGFCALAATLATGLIFLAGH